MKFLFAFLIVAVAFFSVQAISAERRAKLADTKKECIAESGVSEDAIKILSEIDFSKDCEKLKKYTYCFMTKTGMASEDGKFIKEALIKRTLEAVENNLSKNVDKCAEEVGEDKVETMWKANKCFVEKNPKLVSVIYGKQ